MEVAENSSLSANDVEDTIDDAIKSVVKQRRKQIQKCSKKLEDMIQLQIDAVLNAKVELTLPGVVATEEDVSQCTEATDSAINISEDMDEDSDASICNDPGKDEAVSCNDLIGDVEGTSSTVRNIASKVQRMHKIPNAELLALFRDDSLST